MLGWLFGRKKRKKLISKYCILLNSKVDCREDYSCVDCNDMLNRVNNDISKHYKTCTKCKQVKDIKLFSKDSRRSDGLRSWCKRCDSETRLKKHREIKPNKTKRCRVCLEYKEISQFNKKSDSNDGLQSCCKECSRIKSRKYRNSKNDKTKLKPNKYVVDELGIVTFKS